MFTKAFLIGDKMKVKFLNRKDKSLLKRAISYTSYYKKKLVVLLLVILLGIIFTIIQPALWGKLSGGFVNKNFNESLKWLILILIVSVISIVLDIFKSYILSYINSNLMNKINNELYSKIINLNIKAFDEMSIGEFISRINGDTGSITNIITSQLINGIVDLIKVIAIGVIIFKINILLSTCLIAIFPITYLIFGLFGKVLREKNREIRQLNDRYFSNVQQSLFGIREVKGLGLKDSVIGTFNDTSEKIKDKSIELSILNAISISISDFVGLTTVLSMIVLGIYLIYNGRLNIEAFVAFIAYSSQFGQSLRGITQINSNIQQLLSSLERVFELLDNEKYDSDKYGTKSLEHPKGIVKFEDISFHYVKDKQIFSNLNINIKGNEKIAIVGKSGAGKTTLFNLLMGFYKPQKGKITIDGIDIRELEEENLRKNVSIIAQRPFLFNISIKDNLLLVKPSATEQEIIDVCKIACIHNFIDSLPKKYETIIGENGVNFSVGQVQRIAIARCLLKDSKIMLFDEATSALDNESQYSIKTALNNISKNRTVILIAHRLSTIFDADEIILIDNGKVAGKGTHDYLIRHNEAYKKLYSSEFEISKINVIGDEKIC